MFVKALVRRASFTFEFIGRHPTWILVLPSIWMLGRFLPFWKDIDAVHQLISPAWDANILHFPPIYCFGARLPFWLTEILISGRAPSIFAEQNPPFVAVFALVILQHAGVWAALRYFLFSLPFSDLNRGIVAVMLASVASFYVYAHTCGSDAMTSVTWFLVFGAGLRVLTATSTWRTWILYIAALILAVGSRHINGVLLGWLPLTTLLLIGFRWVYPKSNQSVSVSRQACIAGAAVVAGFVVLGIEDSLVAYLSHRFNVIKHPTFGVTFSDRIATWISLLSGEEKDRLLVRVEALTADANTRLAIESQIKLGPYHMGTDRVIRRALEEEGFPKEKIQAETDRVILRATICFYETLDPGLVWVILREFAKGWAPTSDYRVATFGPAATLRFASTLDRDPLPSPHLPQWPIFDLVCVRNMVERAGHDWVIGHWQGIPIMVWSVFFVCVGVRRLRRNKLSLEVWLVGLTVLGIGAAAYAATCVCVYSTPRYVLPLLVSVFAFGSMVFSNDRNHAG
jgi:hypothetical protein